MHYKKRAGSPNYTYASIAILKIKAGTKRKAFGVCFQFYVQAFQPEVELRRAFTEMFTTVHLTKLMYVTSTLLS